MVAIPLGWMQLRHRKLRLLVALTGIAFAVVLILMQLGFRSSLFESAVRYHDRFHYDLVVLSTEMTFIVAPETFSSRRLYQALGVAGVASVTPVYMSPALWKNPFDHSVRRIFTVGIDPAADPLAAPGVREHLDAIKERDVVLFDAKSRPEFGPVPERIRAGQAVEAEVNGRRVEVAGLYEMGTSFGIDGSLLTSDTNFLRLFPNRARTQIDLGLVSLAPGADREAVRKKIVALLPRDVRVLTKDEYAAAEVAYWNSTTPIGYVFSFGVIIGIVVGSIIVYQILFADVQDHLPEYGTLKAMGYSNRYVSGVVLQQAVILSVLGFLPGLAASAWLYRTAGAATRLPLHLTPARIGMVLLLTVGMCVISGLLALRKVRALDPADIF